MGAKIHQKSVTFIEICYSCSMLNTGLPHIRDGRGRKKGICIYADSFFIPKFNINTRWRTHSERLTPTYPLSS